MLFNRRVIAVIVLLFVLPGMLLAAELPFAVHTASYQFYPKLETFDGTIEASKRATISSETSGRISEINVDVDDEVKKGAVIIRITDAKHRAQLSGVEANVSEAEAQFYVASSEFNRIKDVFNKKLVSRSQYDQANAKLKAAQQRLSAAKAKVKEVLEQLAYTVVRAPYSGVVAERHVELGEMAKVGQALITGFSFSQLRAVTHIPQSSVAAIRSAKQANILLPKSMFNNADAANGLTPLTPLTSTQITVYPEADANTHTVKVRVVLPVVPGGIYPGQSVKLQFHTGDVRKLRLPSVAVVHRSELTAVYVVNDHGISLRQVRTGQHYTDDSIEILAGLDEGETIAMDPVHAAVYLKQQRQQ
ncbi:MAG: efflux RND transporter periplasmic adaptor subunit [Gammaproteobacteria bacterium]|nr:efflux RND transporter periplasmic adaptor subunit [Gammaproteobacteria bacterium]